MTKKRPAKKKKAVKKATKKAPKKKLKKRSKKTIIGAVAIRVWRDEEDEDPEDNQVEVYISFGEYDEDTGNDSFGVDDEDIFYYVENEAELRKLCSKSAKVNGEDFFLLEYSLVEEG